MVEREDGKQEALDLSRLADRHLRPGWIRAIQSAQGVTADRAMAHLAIFRANSVDPPTIYFAISRAKDAVALHTDSRARLTGVLRLRDGPQGRAIGVMRCGAKRKWRSDRSGAAFGGCPWVSLFATTDPVNVPRGSKQGICPCKASRFCQRVICASKAEGASGVLTRRPPRSAKLNAHGNTCSPVTVTAVSPSMDLAILFSRDRSSLVSIESFERPICDSKIRS